MCGKTEIRNLTTSLVTKLESKEVYLGGGNYVVLRVSWGPGDSSGLLNRRVSGTRGGKGTLKKIIFIKIKFQ